MKKLLILGCNEITEVVLPMLASSGEFVSEIILGDKDKGVCNELKKKCIGAQIPITTVGIDLNNQAGTKMMLSITQPEMIVNLLPPERAPLVMRIALEIGAHYIDNSLCDWNSGELLSKQFEYFGDFRAKNLMAVAGCSFNPAVITTLVRVASDRRFDKVNSADIIEVNLHASKGISDIKSFLNSRELKAKSEKAVMLLNGEKKQVDPLSLKFKREIPDVGTRTLYLLNNPIVEDFSKEIPDVPNVRYFTTYKRRSTAVLDTLEKVGMLSTTPIDVGGGVKIAPIDFLSKVMPASNSSADEEIKGNSVIGIILSGVAGGQDKTVMIYTSADNDECRRRHGVASEGYYNALSVLAGIKLICKGRWNKAGVYSSCAFNPELMLDMMKKDGLSYTIVECDPVDVAIDDNDDSEE